MREYDRMKIRKKISNSEGLASEYQKSITLRKSYKLDKL